MIEIGKSIAENGFIVVAAGAYLLCSSTIIVWFVKWFAKMINNIINRQQDVLDEILQLQKRHHDILVEIGLKIKELT